MPKEVDTMPSLGQVVVCNKCGCTYVHGDAEEMKRHRRRHDACRQTSHVPVPHEQRERQKDIARDTLREAKPDDVGSRHYAAMLWLGALWERSWERALELGDWRHHPSFDVYQRAFDLEHLLPELVPYVRPSHPRTWSEALVDGCGYVRG